MINPNFTKLDYEQYFCGAYMRTICPSEYQHYKKLITWRKLKKIIIEKDYALLKQSQTCYNLYCNFFNNLGFCKKNGEKTPIEYLMLPSGINNCLRRSSIYLIEDLIEKYILNKNVGNIRKIGKVTTEKIVLALNEYDISKKILINKRIINQEEDYFVLWENYYKYNK